MSDFPKEYLLWFNKTPVTSDSGLVINWKDRRFATIVGTELSEVTPDGFFIDDIIKDGSWIKPIIIFHSK